MNKSEIDIEINDAYFDEAMSFYKCGLILQDSAERIEDSTDLFSSNVYLFRHSVELILKALIIKNLNTQENVNWD